MDSLRIRKILVCTFAFGLLVSEPARAGNQETYQAVRFAAPGAVQFTSYQQSIREKDDRTPQWEAASTAQTRYSLIGLSIQSVLPMTGVTSTMEYAWSRNDTSRARRN